MEAAVVRVRGEAVYIWAGRDRRGCRRRSMALVVLLTVATAGLVACTSHNNPVSPGTNAGSSSAGATANAQRAPYDPLGVLSFRRRMATSSVGCPASGGGPTSRRARICQPGGGLPDREAHGTSRGLL